MNINGPAAAITTGAMLRQQATGIALPGAKPAGALAETAAVANQAVEDPHKAQMREAAKAFEAIFMRQMISSMRAATPGDTLFSNDAANQFREMADARLAEDMADSDGGAGGFGIAQMLLKQFGVEE